MKFVLDLIRGSLLLCLLLTPQTLKAQGGEKPPQLETRLSQPSGLGAPAVRFAHLATNDGLASAHVAVIFQDSQGLMWFGTRDGLSRYNGYHFTTFRHDLAEPTSLRGNSISDIIEDKQGRLWFATNRGISIYDPRRERFDPLPLDPPARAITLFQDSKAMIWLGTSTGELLRYNPQSRGLTRFRLGDKAPPGFASAIWEIAEDHAGHLWLAASTALLKFDLRTEQITRYPPPDAPGEIRAVYIDQAGQIWFDGMTLHKFDPVSETMTIFQSPLGPVPIVRTMVDRNRQMWLGTLVGLFRFDLRREQFTDHFTHRLTDPNSLSSSRIFSLFEDRSGLIWIGTENGGLNLFNPRQTQFTTYRHDPDNARSLAAARVTSLSGDESGGLWLGADTILSHFDPATGQMDHFTPTGRISSGPIGITALYQSSTGLVWFGLNNVLYRFNPADSQFKSYNLPGQVEGPPNYLSSIFQDGAGRLWLGRQREGFLLFEPHTETFQPHPVAAGLKNIQVIYRDSSGLVWLAGRKTLGRFDPQQDHLDKFPAPFEEVNGLYRGQDDAVWIAANDGLYRFDPQPSQNKEGFTVYTDRDGLASSSVMAVLGDGSGRLWLSTRRGLSRFNPYSESFRNYDVSDGLAGNEFIRGSAWQMTGDRLVFGGEHGLTLFSPDQISDNTDQPPLILSDVRLFNEPLAIGPDSPLTQALNFTDHLVFTYDQNVISFEFAALSYAAPAKNRYRYKLDGFEKSWNEVGSERRFATYTNLPAGNYRFRVQGTNDSGLWSDQAVALAITITPPWWETPWFRSAALLAIVGLAYGGYRWRIRRVEQSNRLLEQQIAERTQDLRQRTAELQLRTQELALAKEKAEKARYAAEAANQAKSSFLANMSHELRTPLNAILGFSQIMSRSRTLPPEQQAHLEIIDRSSEHLLSLINQVLELSKIEAGQISLSKTTFSLYQMLVELEGMFRLRAADKRLSLVFDLAPAVPRTIRTDEVKLRQVLINILNNALKFTEVGNVTLRVSSETVEPEAGAYSENLHPTCLLCFAVSDTGPGIAAKEMGSVFEAFSQTESGRRSHEGTGLGLSISRKFVQLLGGDIRVESPAHVPGQFHGGPGTTFSFEIRVELTRPPALPNGHFAGDLVNQLGHRVVGLAPHQPQVRILIVDDLPDNRQLLYKLLEPFGFDLHEAETGQQAIDIWQDFAPHLIWMDMRMPVLDGYETTKMIKASQATWPTVGEAPSRPKTKIIAMTASSFEEEKAKMLAAGCDDFLRKPFREAELFQMMSKHLGLEYVYDMPLDSGGKGQIGRESLPGMLADLPQACLGRLQEAIELSDIALAKALISEIRPDQPALSATLEQLMANFEYQKMLEAIKHVITTP